MDAQDWSVFCTKVKEIENEYNESDHVIHMMMDQLHFDDNIDLFDLNDDSNIDKGVYQESEDDS